MIVELLSPSSAANDRGEKMKVYEEIFRTPEYFLFDPHTAEFTGYELVRGRYEPMRPDAHGRIPSDQLDLVLVVRDRELRFFTRAGDLVLKPEEAAEEALRRADDASAEVERLQAELRTLRPRE